MDITIVTMAMNFTAGLKAVIIRYKEMFFIMLVQRKDYSPLIKMPVGIWRVKRSAECVSPRPLQRHTT